MQELRRHPPQPHVANAWTGDDLNAPFAQAAGGQHSTEHPVHARVEWETFDGSRYAEQVWGLMTAWTDRALRVHFWRHGENWEWFSRADVEPCHCETLHEPGWWAAT